MPQLIGRGKEEEEGSSAKALGPGPLQTGMSEENAVGEEHRVGMELLLPLHPWSAKTVSSPKLAPPLSGQGHCLL